MKLWGSPPIRESYYDKISHNFFFYINVALKKRYFINLVILSEEGKVLVSRVDRWAMHILFAEILEL